MIRYKDQTDEVKRDLSKQWYAVELLRKFGNKANLNYFKIVFGEDDAERLWTNFVIACNRDIYKFQTYLNKDQLSDLYANIHLNDKLYIK